MGHGLMWEVIKVSPMAGSRLLVKKGEALMMIPMEGNRESFPISLE